MDDIDLRQSQQILLPGGRLIKERDKEKENRQREADLKIV